MDRPTLVKTLIVGELLINTLMRQTNYFIGQYLHYFKGQYFYTKYPNGGVYYPLDTYCQILLSFTLLFTSAKTYVRVTGWGLLTLTVGNWVDDTYFNYKSFQYNDAIALALSFGALIGSLYAYRVRIAADRYEFRDYAIMYMVLSLFVLSPISRNTTFEVYGYANALIHLFLGLSILIPQQFIHNYDTHFRTKIIAGMLGAMTLHKLLDEWLFKPFEFDVNDKFISLTVYAVGLYLLIESKMRQRRATTP